MTATPSNNPAAIETRARRTAKRFNLCAVKSRVRNTNYDNQGGFRIIHLRTNFCVAGERFNFSAADVIEFCKASAEPVKHENEGNVMPIPAKETL